MKLYQWAFREGSTRPIALLRICAVILLWAKWGDVGALHRAYPDPTHLLIGVAFYATTVLMLVGYHTRIATALTALLIGYGYHGLGVVSGERALWVHHHTDLLKYLIWILALTPCGRSLSVDRWLQLRREEKGGAPAPLERSSLWAQRLIALQLSSLYLWAALAKLKGPYLSGQRMEAFLTEFYLGAEVPDTLLFHAMAAGLACGTVALELSLSVAMLWPRAQPWVLPLGALLHLSFYMLLPVATFSATVVAMYIAVIPPEQIERVLARLLAQRTLPPEPIAPIEQA